MRQDSHLCLAFFLIWTCIHPPNTGWMGWVGGGMVTYLRLAHLLPIRDGLGGWVGGGMITYLGLAYILPYGFDLGEVGVG